MIITTVQTWLQPLRERYPDRQFTDDFLLVRMPDIETCADEEFNHHLFGEVDVRIVFDCKDAIRRPFARLGGGKDVPGVCITRMGEIGELMMRSIFGTLVHEVGHTFGLDDTYVLRGIDDHVLKRINRASTGGLSRTIGKQPSSVMAGFTAIERPGQIAEDDKNGIIYLYEYLYEDHPKNDCFFADYHFVRAPQVGCEPKYPLIFEAKHGNFISVEKILRDDPTLNINAQDHEGMTALHHAVARADLKMVQHLLARQGIKVNIMNKYRQTPAQLALKRHQRHLVKMIKAHPSDKWPLIAWDVSPRHRLTTTWGHLKKQY